MARESLSSGVPTILIYGLLGAAGGAIGTLAIQRLLPEAKPGDGFTVRWLDKDGVERRIDFGSDEKAALARAIDLGQRGMADVEVIEIRQGRVTRIQKAGQKEEVVA